MIEVLGLTAIRMFDGGKTKARRGLEERVG